MKTFVVVDKQSGAEVHRYESTEAVEWSGMEFDTHDHAELVEVFDPVGTGPRRLTKIQFTDRMGDAAYAAILAMAKTEVAVEVFVDRFRNATPELDGTSIDLADPRTIAGVTAIGQALYAMGVVGSSWAKEVLNGN